MCFGMFFRAIMQGSNPFEYRAEQMYFMDDCCNIRSAGPHPGKHCRVYIMYMRPSEIVSSAAQS